MAGGPGSGESLTAPLAYPDFRRLWAALAVSMVGDGVYFVALPFLVLSLEDTATALATVAIAFTVSQLALLLPAGAIADRAARRRLLLAADLLRAAALTGIVVIGTVGQLALWQLWGLAAIFGIGNALFGPALEALVPQLLPARLLVGANALEGIARPIAYRMAGPVLGGLLVAGIGPLGALAADAATFLISAGLIARITTTGRPDGADLPSRSWQRILEGFRFTRQAPWLAIMLVAAAIANLCLAGINQVLVPFLIESDLTGSATDYAWLLAINGAGFMAGAWYANRRGQLTRTTVPLYVAWGAGTALLAGYAPAAAPWQLLPVAFVQGVVFAPGGIWWNTLLQVQIPNRLLGRITSLDWFISYGLIPVGHALAGRLADTTSTPTAITVLSIGGAVTLGTASLLPAARRLPAPAAEPD